MLAKKGLSAAPSAVAQYVEDVYSTYLHTGTGSSLTITNNIDLSGEGGLVWIKRRDGVEDHVLTDTVRGAGNTLFSNTTGANDLDTTRLSSFTSSGFTLGTSARVNQSSGTYASFTFRKAEKFFDVVTYTGDGTNNRLIAHNLGSTPGCVIVKNTSGSSTNWCVWHRSLSSTNRSLFLNKTDSDGNNLSFSSNQTPMSSTNFVVSAYTVTAENTNTNGATYVAYLFAHDAGGFGDAGDQSVISCGSFSYSSGFTSYSLGYEPQWVMVKRSDGVGSWYITDIMRNASNDGANDSQLKPNASDSEADSFSCYPTATGFTIEGLPAGTYIYIAIRRGPMKTPEAGTEVFSPTVYTGTNADNRLINTSLLTDMVMIKERNDTVDGMVTGDRLRGDSYLLTGTTDAETSGTNTLMTPTSGVGNAFSAMNGVGVGNNATSKVNIDTTSNNHVAWAFKRAPGFFDVVCYTGTGSATQTYTHNLGVAPELMIVKCRNDAGRNWQVYSSSLGNGNRVALNQNLGSLSTTIWNSTSPTATQFTVTSDSTVGANTFTYVAYLFASVSGVSSIGTYTGNGSSVTVTTGFQPRFVLVKRTDSTGNWIVGDSARGLVASSDPALFLNTTDAETTGQDWVDVSSTGFTVNETALNANVNTGTYIYLAIS